MNGNPFTGLAGISWFKKCGPVLEIFRIFGMLRLAGLRQLAASIVSYKWLGYPGKL
jgi:hypothetical protein